MWVFVLFKNGIFENVTQSYRILNYKKKENICVKYIDNLNHVVSIKDAYLLLALNHCPLNECAW